jgi:hypothetical protein
VNSSGDANRHSMRITAVIKLPNYSQASREAVGFKDYDRKIKFMQIVLDSLVGSAYKHPMSTMLRRTIAFTQAQMSFLKKEAAGLEISIADFLRRIIDEYRNKK